MIHEEEILETKRGLICKRIMIFQQKFLTKVTWQRVFKILITKRLVHTCGRKRKKTEIKCPLERENEERKGGK